MARRTLAGLSVLALLAPPLALAAEPEKPNVVILLADDMGWADVGYHGSRIETPSLDRLAAEGVQLDRFYATPICSPTRAALMTGRDPMKLGMAYHALMPWHTHGVALEEHFMPESFRAAGYQTAIIGKWHLGHTIPRHHPTARGFDYYFGNLHTAVDYFTHLQQGGYDLQRNGTSVPARGRYSTTLAGEEARGWIEKRDRSRPFFLYVPFLAPHNPMQAPEELIEKYAWIPADTPPPHRHMDRRITAAMIDALDQAIGRILDALDDEGIAENTIVLFFSDNGGSSANGSSNAPLRGWKATTYEGGIRVLSLIRWPARLAAGQVNEQMMTVTDVFPTLAAAAGVTPRGRKPLDGRNLWTAIESGEPVAREEDLLFTVENPMQGLYYNAVFRGEWKLVQIVDQLLEKTTVQHELFRIRDDPSERSDLAADHPDVVAELAARIHRWRMQHPVGGSGTQLVPHPGWRPPWDWAEAMRAMGTRRHLR
jgi:arylsulfatase A-like enzyme